MATQIPLGIRLRCSATFDNYIPGPNAEPLGCLQQILRAVDKQSIYLWGADSTGKSHLLQAACHEITSMRGAAAYVPLDEAEKFGPEMLDGMENMALVCIDDIDKVAGIRDWEVALFHLYNRLRENKALMVISAHASPGGVPIDMPDLRSRLSWGMVFQLFQLNDEGKIDILQQRAWERGMEMPSEVACYLLRRFPRDMHALLAVLDHLDYASQVAQRKLTIPFIKESMEISG